MRGSFRCTFASAVACLLAWGAAEAQAKSEFDLPAQSLADSLRAIGSQTNTNVLFDPVLVGARQAPALQGEWTTNQALARLLVGTGLRYEFLSDKTVVLATESSARPAHQDGIRPAASWDETARMRGANNSETADSSAADKSGFWSRFRLAQANQSQIPESASSTQESSSKEGSDTKGKHIEEVVVTAQKREERLQNVPISVSVVRGDDLDSSSISGVTEILNNVPAVATTEGLFGGGTQVAVRGVAAGGPEFAGSSPIAYYIDSVPFGFVRTASGPDLGPYDLDRIEVLRGPQGTLYGASALNGVVRVLTKDADLDEFSVKARALGSSTEEGEWNYRGDAAINIPLITGKLAARAVVGYQDQSGWIDNLIQNDVNDAELQNYRLKLNAAPTERLSIGVHAWRQRDDRGGPSVSDDEFLRAVFQPEPISTDTDTYGFNIGYDAAAFSVASMTGFVDYEKLGSFAGPTAGGLYFATDLRSRVFSQELVLTSHKDDAWRWTVGAFYRDAEDRTRQGLGPSTGDFSTIPVDNFEDKSESLAFFGEIGRRFANDRWEWTGGLRYFQDDVSTQMIVPPLLPNVPLGPLENSFEKITPRVVLTWFPKEDLTVYTSYAEGFRSGVPQSELVTTLVPDFPPVEPDELKNYEIGAKGRLGERISYDAAVFYVDWDDVQQVTGVPIPGVEGGFASATINGASASGIGFDFALNARPLDALDVRLTAGWNDVTMDEPIFSAGQVLYDKGDRLSLSPEWTAGASAEYSFALGASGYQAQLMAGATYTSEQKASTSTAVPSGVLGDEMLISRLRLSINAPDHWSAALFVDNLNDDRGTPVPGVAGLPQFNTRVRPRTVGAQLEYRF